MNSKDALPPRPNIQWRRLSFTGVILLIFCFIIFLVNNVLVYNYVCKNLTCFCLSHALCSKQEFPRDFTVITKFRTRVQSQQCLFAHHLAGYKRNLGLEISNRLKFWYQDTDLKPLSHETPFFKSLSGDLAFNNGEFVNTSIFFVV